jgi:hypothetical protein
VKGRFNPGAVVRMTTLAMALVVLGLVAWAALFPHQSLVILGFGQGYNGGGAGGAGNVPGNPAAGAGPGSGVGLGPNAGPISFTAVYLVLAVLVLLGILWVVRTREKPNND